MASNISFIVILVLTFYASSGSLLLIRQGSGCAVSECERPNSETSFAKRSADSYDGPESVNTVEWSPDPDEIDLLPLWQEFRARVKMERASPHKHLVPWGKRSVPNFHSGNEEEIQYLTPKTAADILTQRLTSQFIFRLPKKHRKYDVLQIECPQTKDGMDRFACPSPDRMGRYRCIDDNYLCDGFIDCPSGEDEDREDCMFYKTMKAHLDILADAVLRWVRGR